MSEIKKKKARLTNEIERRYREKTKRLEERLRISTNVVFALHKELADTKDLVLTLQSELEKYKEWTERMQDFCNMSDKDRQEYLKNQDMKFKTQMEVDTILSKASMMFSQLFI